MQKDLLLIDGAHLFVGSKKLSEETNRRLVMNDRLCQAITRELEKRTGKRFDMKFYLTAEKDVDAIMHRKTFYKTL